jgi:nitrogen fixation protein FixH
MSAQTLSPVGYRVKGWHVAAAVVAFFAVVIGVDATFMVLAYRSHPGQVSVTPYEDGLLYNQRIAQLQAQDRLGWRAAAESAPGVVAMMFQDAEGRPLGGLTLSAKLQRPTTDKGAVTLKFSEAAPGRYEAPTGEIDGAWDLSAEARDAKGAVFIAERRLSWP